MLGLDKGIMGTMIGGGVIIAIVYVGLKYSSGLFQIGPGAARSFGNFAKVAQGK